MVSIFVDKSVGLPIFEPSGVPLELRAQFPFITGSQSVPRIYSISLCAEVVSFPGREDSARGPSTRELQPRMMVVAYDSIVVCCVASGTVTRVLRFSSVAPPAISNSLRPDAKKRNVELESVQRPFAGFCTADDDASLCALMQRSANTAEAVETSLFLFPVQKECKEMTALLRHLWRFHRGDRAVNPPSWPESSMPRAKDLRQRWEMQCEHFPLAKGIAASNVVVAQQLPHVLHLGFPVVDDRMKQLRDEHTALERSANAVPAEIAREYNKAMVDLDVRSETILTQEHEVDKWAREIDKKEAEVAQLEAELRRSKEAVRRSTAEREQLSLTFTEEIQSWRAILSQRQSEELKARESLLKAQQRSEQTLDDIEADILDLDNQHNAITRQLLRYEMPEYTTKVKQRDELLRVVTEQEQLVLEQEGEPKRALEVRLAELKKQEHEALSTNKALRRIIADAKESAQAEEAAQRDLECDIANFTQEIVNLQDELLLVEVELARSRRAVAEKQKEHATMTRRVVAAERESANADALFEDPMSRYRLARLRAHRAAVERESVAQAAQRASSIHQSAEHDLQQKILYEAIRLKRDASMSPESSEGPALASPGQHADPLSFLDGSVPDTDGKAMSFGAIMGEVDATLKKVKDQFESDACTGAADSVLWERFHGCLEELSAVKK